MIALSPIILFFLIYVGGSVLLNDFYALPISIAFLASTLYAIFLYCRRDKLEDRINVFLKGAGQSNIMYMVLIFIMAGAFANLAKSMGSIDAIANLTLAYLPTSMILPGCFLAASIISMGIGTSVGTIAALAPLAAGVAAQTGGNTALFIGCVVGGAFFGDNLSFISDTTIVATRSLGITMMDKFKANFRIALPAAIITIIIYIFVGSNIETSQDFKSPNFLLVLPYLVVLLTSIFRVNVILVLAIGIVLSIAIALGYGHTPMPDILGAMNGGIMNMGELIVVSMLAGGLIELVRKDGGVDILMKAIRSRVHNRCGAELSMSLMVMLADFCTANNTIAILITGNLSKEISDEYNVPAPHTASLLGIWSCVAQSIIPYGAQLLLAAGMVSISPVKIIPYLFYPFVLAIVTLFFTFFLSKAKKPKQEIAK